MTKSGQSTGLGVVGVAGETLYRWRGPRGGWIYDERKPSWPSEQLEVRAALAPSMTPTTHPATGDDRGFMPLFALGDRVRKTKGASWQGRVVGFYSTALTPVGYAVESEREPGSVQIYPETALALTTPEKQQ